MLEVHYTTLKNSYGTRVSPTLGRTRLRWLVLKRVSFQRILPSRAIKYSFDFGMAAAALALGRHLSITTTIGGRPAVARDRVFARHYFPLKLYM